ncbi:Expansin-like protein [Quillaja saponaria]|uniref:Expansin-like protein n=1 Tax=Quillaja saponaria TaxID=32244 RepID=A0AAD7KS72_QUISA|nr:Expansin-like protein [Quillaja saponaria]
MDFALRNVLGLVCVILLLPALCTSQNTIAYSRATYYGSPDCYGTPTGACGFGEYGRTVYDGSVSGVSRLFRNGSGCGACYQVRCTNPQYCDENGAYVVVTDYGEGDNTDFILSPRAYSSLGRNPDASKGLFQYGVVEVEYRRVSCIYPGYNIVFKVTEHSKYPHYLAIVPLYIAGQNDIVAVDIWQEDYQGWRPMRRAYGAVWDAANPPTGELKLRFQVRGSAGIKWVQSTNSIPSYWKAGDVYDSNTQLD